MLYSITKNDNKNVRSDTLHKIANALKIDVDDLMDSIVEKYDPISITLDLSNNKHLTNLRILEWHFEKLNFAGEDEAIKRIEELTHLSKYTDNKELLIKPINSD